MFVLSRCCLLLLSAAFTVLWAAPTPAPNCTDVLLADIYCLVDGSNSINYVGWGRALNFVDSLTKSFPLGPNNVQFAYGTFSTTFVHIFNLDTYYDHDNMSQKILSTTQLKGLTYTFDALKAIRVNGYLQDPDKGARPGVPKVLIIVTDGNSDNINKTIAEANALRSQPNTTINVISVGNVNQVECLGIAGSEKNIFSVKSFSGLQAIKDQITQHICVKPDPEPDPCPADVQLDLVYAIDSSSSVGAENYNTNFEFVIQSLRSFTLGSSSTQVALLTFGSTVNVVFGLTNDKNGTYQGLMNVPYQNSAETNTHLALTTAQQLLSVENGGREQAKKVVVVITAGVSSDPNKTLAAASLLRGLQILVVTLGVGGQVSQQELTAVATEPTFVVPVASYSALVSYANNVSDIACNTPKPPPTVPPCPPATIVDIFFLVDSSGSIGADKYNYNFQFIQKIIDAYYIAEDGAKIALLTFGTSVKPRFPLSGDPDYIRQQLQNVPYQGSTTNTHLALRYVIQSGWNDPANGARNGSKVIILITDGYSSVPDETQEAANEVKAAGFTVIVVGVGGSVNQDEINSVASKPEYAITVDDYSVLDYIASTTSEIACHNPKK